jgi:hypothetical protein
VRLLLELLEELKFNTRKAMAKGFDTQLQDIAVKKNKSWRPSKCY